jgi:pyruvate dehydrogenase E2 component (dihydrolipoamide acetyltransferase)
VPAAAPAAAPPAAVAAVAPPPAAGARVAASPLARRAAQAAGVDLARIVGTGPGGRVTADDVAHAPVSTAPAAHASDYPIGPEAAYLAAKLAHSAQTAPHYYLTMDIKVGKALALLAELNGGEDAKIGLGDLFVKAAASATVAVPDVNASWLDGVVRKYQRVDVNLVVGAGDGLRAPVLIDVDAMSLKDVAGATSDALHDEAPYSAGTLTVQNLGSFGLHSAAPIVHTPQAACLALGAVVDAAALVDGRVVNQPKLAATLAADHRVVDGAVGAAWLAALRGLVEAPAKLLL